MKKWNRMFSGINWRFSRFRFRRYTEKINLIETYSRPLKVEMMPDNFTRALRGEDHEGIPVWFMRQAGRYLPGYSRIRNGLSFKEMMSNQAVIEEITYEPVKEIGVDAAIIFSDILLPLEAMGFSVEFTDKAGPKVKNNYSKSRFRDIHEFEESSYPYPTEKAISDLKEKYGVPVIGFSGAPLTLLSYLLMDFPDRDMIVTKSFMIDHAGEFRNIMILLSEMVSAYCRMQIRAGVDAIQIFDSWAGYLSPYEFERYEDPYLVEITSEIGASVPLIYFSTQSSFFIGEMKAAFDFLSIDWRVRIGKIAQTLPDRFGLQGNLDPSIINTSRYLEETKNIIEDAAGLDRYIFNTGHGILPQTDPKRLREIVDYVHGL